MVYLTCDDLIELNSWATALFGGIDGVRDIRALESCVALPKTSVFDHERFRDPHEKAAAYCFFLTRNHPFFDGNKRTAFLAALHFLRENGFKVVFDEHEMFAAIIGVAKGEIGVEELFPLFERAIKA